MKRKKILKNSFLIISVIIVVAIILFLTLKDFKTLSIVSGSWDIVTPSISNKLTEGIYFSISAVAGSSGTGQQYSWSGNQTISGALVSMPFKETMYPVVSGVSESFPMSVKNYISEDVSISYMLWARTDTNKGDWTMGLTGSSNEGIASCRAIDKGHPFGLPGDYYVGFYCDVYFNLTCPYSECQIRSVYGINVENLFIYYKNYEPEELNVYRFENNSCNLIIIMSDEITEKDYENLEECEVNIKNDNPELIIGIIVLSIILLTIIILFIIKKRGKNNGKNN